MESQVHESAEFSAPGGPLSLCLLASGSKGNCVWVQAGDAAVVIDCGISVKMVRGRAQTVGANPARLDAILLSHDHGDHIAGVPRLAGALELQVHASDLVCHRTGFKLRNQTGREPKVFADGEILEIGELEITPIPVPHDAAGTCGFLFEYQGRRAAHLTDLGHVPADFVEILGGVELLSIESNHDEDMLAKGPYPEFLKRRVAGDYGHLSNRACAQLVAELAASGDALQQVVLAHLSETNNTPKFALQQTRAALDAAGRADVKVALSAQRRPSGVFSL